MSVRVSSPSSRSRWVWLRRWYAFPIWRMSRACKGWPVPLTMPLLVRMAAISESVCSSNRTSIAETTAVGVWRICHDANGIGSDRVRSCPPLSLIWTVMVLSVLARVASVTSRRMTRLRSRIGVAGLFQSAGKSEASAVTASR